MIFTLSFKKQEIALCHKQHRNVVRKILGSSFIEFKKTQFSTNTADNFNEIMVNCFYDDDNLLQEVEIFEPNIVYVLENKNFLGKPNTEIKNKLLELNIAYDLDDIGIIIDNLGIATVSNKTGQVECIYFDLERAPYLNIN